VGNLRVLNISVGDGIPVAERLSVPHKDNARQTLQAFLGAGLDATPLKREWQDTDTDRRCTYGSTRTCRLQIPLMTRSVIFGRNAVRDPFFGPVFRRGVAAGSSASGPDHERKEASAINMTTLVDIAVHCFLDDEGGLHRHRLHTRNGHLCTSQYSPPAADILPRAQ
jgi:hypothetical protein